MDNLLKTVRFGASSRRALAIAAGAAGVVMISSSAGFSQPGMPLSSDGPLQPLVAQSPRGEKLTYTYVVTGHGTKIQISVNKKPLITVEKKGDGYALTDPNGSGHPILTVQAPKHM